MMRIRRLSFSRASLMPAAVTAAMLAAGLLATPHSATAQPALPASSSSSLHLVGPLGQPSPEVQRAVENFAHQPWVPPQVRDALLAGIAFAAGTGELGGPPLPDDAPRFHQAFWPTVSPNCMGPGMNSTGSAIAVPGPAPIPVPAPGHGQTTFVFTALGTEAADPHQGDMKVYWLNLGNLRSGVTPFENNGINQTGPATLSAAADTGTGTILAVVAGAVNTNGSRCGFAPTALTATVH